MTNPYLYPAPSRQINRLNSYGLIAYWPMNDGAGLTARDVVGFNSAALTNGPAWVENRALSFDGSNDNATLNACPILQTGKFTIAFWAKLNNLSVGSNANSQTFINFYIDAANAVRIGHDETGAGGSIFCSHIVGYATSFGRATPVSVIASGKWAHIAASRIEGGNVAIYINGRRLDSTSNTYSIGVVNRIGSKNTTDGIINGALKEVLVYNRKLSESEVLGLYTSQYPIFRRTPVDFFLPSAGQALPTAFSPYFMTTKFIPSFIGGYA